MLSRAEKSLLQDYTTRVNPNLESLSEEMRLREKATPQEQIEIYGYALRAPTKKECEPTPYLDCQNRHATDICERCRGSWILDHSGHVCRDGQRGIFPGCYR
jgi:hypothetical protein